MSMKNSSDTIGNRNRDLPTCSAVPQPTALRRAPRFFEVMTYNSVKLIESGLSCATGKVGEMKCNYQLNGPSRNSIERRKAGSRTVPVKAHRLVVNCVVLSSVRLSYVNFLAAYNTAV